MNGQLDLSRLLSTFFTIIALGVLDLVKVLVIVIQQLSL